MKSLLLLVTKEHKCEPASLLLLLGLPITLIERLEAQ